MCCVFRDGILHTLVVMSGYLSYCCLSIISNQSAHSPLTSDINEAFSSTQLLLTEYFLFFGPFSVNPRDGCAKIPVDQQFLKYSDQFEILSPNLCYQAIEQVYLIKWPVRYKYIYSFIFSTFFTFDIFILCYAFYVICHGKFFIYISNINLKCNPMFIFHFISA